MAEAVQAGRRVGLIAAVPATLRDAESFLQQAARESGTLVDTYPRLAEDLMVVKRREGEAAYCLAFPIRDFSKYSWIFPTDTP
jgi:hypothetical protein